MIGGGNRRKPVFGCRLSKEGLFCKGLFLPSCHHIVFGSRIADAVDFKGRRIPLAEDGFVCFIFMLWSIYALEYVPRSIDISAFLCADRRISNQQESRGQAWYFFLIAY